MELKDFEPLDLFLITASILTGAIHLYVGVTTQFHQLTLAGLGFIGGTAIFAYGFRRKLVVAASIPFTAYQMYAYYIGYGFSFSPIAAVDKIAQVMFILGGLFYLYRKMDQL